MRHKWDHNLPEECPCLAFGSWPSWWFPVAPLQHWSDGSSFVRWSERRSHTRFGPPFQQRTVKCKNSCLLSAYSHQIRTLSVLRPINADWNLTGRRTQPLIKSTISSDPEIVFGDAHGGQEARARRLVYAEQEAHHSDHVVLDKRLVEQSV